MVGTHGQEYTILSLFSSHIYPPTYTNGLKEIGNSLGYKWSFDNASGIQSIVWRKKWELTNNDNFKQLLLSLTDKKDNGLKINNTTSNLAHYKIEEQVRGN